MYLSTPMAVAFGRSATDAALYGQLIPSKQLDALANRAPRHQSHRRGPRKRAVVLRGHA
jgi:hypothetical protein